MEPVEGDADETAVCARCVAQEVRSAWHARNVANVGANPVLVLVGGYAGSGKTEFARFLSDLSGWALLDKDTLTRRMTERLSISLGADLHDRHTTTYRTEVRPHEYRSLMNAAYGNLDCGPVAPCRAPAADIDGLRDAFHLTRRPCGSAKIV
ncbi:hypothetical protein GCM10022254_64190 [Actinomadura meridiana]|uniref:Uncharacterized protein n=1 Tax=Actinomadura meridiana TaxID=559626 RepID=A0ABP8CK10_9ACTN